MNAISKVETTKKPTVLKSSFAILDVKQGRGPLFKSLGFPRKDGPAPIPVTITGFIVGAWGEDDGTSREFEVDVSGVQLT
jgi:hypothetical protein